MHYRSFITFNKEIAENSQQAREYVTNYLEDEGFCSDGFFSNGVADWFVIGGRWSGELQGIEIIDDVRKLLKIKKDDYISSKDLENEDNKIKINKIWKDKGGKGENPYYRDNYNSIGYEDDAMIVTKEIYDKALKEFEKIETDGEHFWDLDYEEVSKEFIGNKWIVVVDYHN